MGTAYRLIPDGMFLIGDSAYSLSPWLLKAYQQIDPTYAGASTVEQLVFNLVATRVRQKAEHINAHIQARFKSWGRDYRFCPLEWNYMCADLTVHLHNFAQRWHAEKEPLPYQTERQHKIAGIAARFPSAAPQFVMPTVDYARAATDAAYRSMAGKNVRDAVAKAWTRLFGAEVLVASSGGCLHALWKRSAGAIGFDGLPPAAACRKAQLFVDGVWKYSQSELMVASRALADQLGRHEDGEDEAPAFGSAFDDGDESTWEHSRGDDPPYPAAAAAASSSASPFAAAGDAAAAPSS